MSKYFVLIASSEAASRNLRNLSDFLAQQGVETKSYGAYGHSSIKFSAALSKEIKGKIAASFRLPIKLMLLSYLFLVKFFFKRPNCIVLTDDRAADHGCAASWAAKKLTIPVVLLPVAHWLEGRDLLHMRRQDRTAFEIGSSSATRLPIWQADARNYRFYREAVEPVIVWLHGRELNPWFMGLGYSTNVCCESKRVMKQLRDLDPNKKLEVTGNPQHDLIFSQATNKKIANREGPLIALPQFFEHGLMAWDEQRTLVQRLVDHSLKSFGPVTISLHPSMKRSNYSFLLSDEVEISDIRSEELVALHEVLIGGFTSLIVWNHLAKGISLVFDPLDFDYRREAFPYDSRITNFCDWNKFETVVNEKSTLSELAVNNNLQNDEYMFDGKATKRIVNYLMTLTDGGRV